MFKWSNSPHFLSKGFFLCLTVWEKRKTEISNFTNYISDRKHADYFWGYLEIVVEKLKERTIHFYNPAATIDQFVGHIEERSMRIHSDFTKL